MAKKRNSWNGITYADTYKETVTHNFGWALMQLKAGKAVFRTGWKGVDMCIFMIEGERIEYNKFVSLGSNGCQAYDPPKDIVVADHIDMKAADGTYVTGWNPSNADILSTDWELYSYYD